MNLKIIALNIAMLSSVSSMPAETSYKFSKQGILFDSVPVMPGPGAYWPTLVDMTGVSGFPYEWALYFSTDHQNSGGIWLYLGNGEPSAPGNWTSYDDALARGDFDYLATKPAGNPIYSDSVEGFSTETAYVNLIEGVGYMTYHNNQAGHNQSTLLATSKDGVNFSRLTDDAYAIVVDYDPATAPGDGHTGYFRWGANPFSGVNYRYVGYSLHGGGEDFHSAMWGSDDAVKWTRLQIFDPDYGGTHVEPGLTLVWHDFDPNNVIAMGGGEYAGIIKAASKASGDAARINVLYEIFLADDGKTITRQPRRIISIGSSTDPDGGEVAHPVMTRIGDTQHLVYQGATVDGKRNRMMGAKGFFDVEAPLPERLDEAAGTTHWNRFDPSE